jgi:hypothetical protein
MIKPTTIIISNKNNIKIKNSISLDISLDVNIHGLSIVDYVDNFIEKILINNSDIKWIIYDLELNNDNIENMIIVNSFLPHYIYNKYKNQNILFNSNGFVFGDGDWNRSEVDSHIVDTPYSKSISNGEIIGDRAWTIRYDLISNSMLELSFIKDKIYYGSVNTKYSYITTNALNKIIEGIITNYKNIKSGVYHVTPKDILTEFELLNYICWKNNSNCYIERSTSIKSRERILKSSKKKALKDIWINAGYPEIPTFKMLLEEV